MSHTLTSILKLLVLLLILILAPTTIRSQQNRIDSLETALQGSSGLDRINTLMNLQREYGQLDPQKTLAYGYETLIIPELRDLPDKKSTLHLFMGTAYVKIGAYDSSFVHLDSCASISGRIGDFKKQAYTFRNIGVAYYYMMDYETSLTYARKADSLFEVIHDTIGRFRTISNIGLIYSDMNDFSNALKSYTDSYEIATEVGDTESQFVLLVNMTDVYYRLREYEEGVKLGHEILNFMSTQDSSLIGDIRYYIGTCFLELKNYDSSLYYLNKSLLDTISDHLLENQFYTTQCIGKVYREQGLIDSALIMFEQANDMAVEIDDPIMLAGINMNVGIAYYQKKEMQLALQNLLRSYNICEEQNEFRHMMKIVHYLSLIYEKQGNYNKALLFYKKYIVLNDSAFKTDSYNMLSRWQVKYENEKSIAGNSALMLEIEEDDLAIARGKTRKYIFIILVFTLIVSTLLLIPFYRSIKKSKNIIEIQNQRVEEKNLKIREILKNIHDHIYNNLQTIQGIMAIQARQSCTNETRAILLSTLERISSIQAMHDNLYMHEDVSGYSLQAYIDEIGLNLIQFNNIDPEKISISHSIDSVHLDKNTTITLGIIINELLSNALKYAFPDGKNGEINIELKSFENSEYSLTVHDNGVGYPGSLDIEHSDSFGLYRIKTLSKSLKGEFTVQSSEGAHINIHFS